VAYAVQLIDPEAPSFDHVMRRIAYKHVSLGIRPEQYAQDHALREVFGPDLWAAQSGPTDSGT
jgi:hemoglobin-like flavoprotein